MRKVLAVTLLFVCGVLRATDYYVDYDNGSDSNTGTSSGSAWKHCPDDPNASGNADITLSAGDRVLFKGGVQYKGTFSINASGTSGNPVIYKGDAWGTGKAIIEGAEALTGWAKCTSAADCGGNANWQNIYYTTTTAGGDLATEINLYQEDKMLAVAQYPNPDDPFFMDNTSSFLSYDAATATSITDDALTAFGSDLVGMYAYIYAETNQMYFREITAYSSGQITFSSVPNDPAGKYSLANGLHDQVLDRAGEFVYDKDTDKLYVWPLDGADLTAVNVYISVRSDIVDLNDHDYITFEGISFQRGMGRCITSSRSDGIIVKDCEIMYFRSSGIDNVVHISYANDCTFDGNLFKHNARLRGIVINQDGTDISYLNNRFIKIGRTCMVFHAVSDGTMRGNYVVDCTGVHSNGLTAYGLGSDKCENITIEDNIVLRSNVSLTFQLIDGLVVRNNLFDGGGNSYPMACWASSNSTNVTVYHNTLVNSGTLRCGFFALPDGSASMPTSVIKNNIIDGMPDYDGDIAYNLYTMYAVGQISGETGGGVQFNKALIFTDWENDDWTLTAGSPAIDAGTDVGITDDMNGVSRAIGSAPDKGCYEYDPTGMLDVTEGPVWTVAGALVLQRVQAARLMESGEILRMDGIRVTDSQSLGSGFHLYKEGTRMKTVLIVE